MTSNGASTYSSSTGSTSNPCSELGDIEPSRGGRGESGGPKSEEQALFWAAVSGCMALTGQTTGADDDDSSTVLQGHGERRSQDSGSSSPRSPTHSSFSDETFGWKREREHGGYELPRTRPKWAGAGGLPGEAFTGRDSFCCKLASVLANDKRLVAQPIALRALQRAGVIEAKSPSGLASSLSDPALVGHLTVCLAATAGIHPEELNRSTITPPAAQRAASNDLYRLTGSVLRGSQLSAYSSSLLAGSQLPMPEPRVADPSEHRKVA